MNMIALAAAPTRARIAVSMYRQPVARATKEGFTIFSENDFEARRNGFHAEVINASFRLRKMDRSRLPAVRACQ